MELQAQDYGPRCIGACW